jgi:hypothetical protein
VTTIDTLIEQTYPHAAPIDRRITAYGNAAQAIRETMEPVEPLTASVRIKTLMGQVGAYELRDRGVLTLPVVMEPQRPGRIAPMNEEAQDVLDSFFERGAAWKKLNDEAIYTYVLRFANEQHITPPAARSLSLAVCLALCYRAGITPTRDQVYGPEGGR